MSRRAQVFEQRVGEDLLAVVAPSTGVCRNCLCKCLRAKAARRRMPTAQLGSVVADPGSSI